MALGEPGDVLHPSQLGFGDGDRGDEIVGEPADLDPARVAGLVAREGPASRAWNRAATALRAVAVGHV